MSHEPDQKTREQLLEDSLLEGTDSQVGSLVLRPINIQTIRNVDRLGLTFLQGGIGELTREQIVRQLSVFAWFQSQPIREVLTHLREGTWEDEVDIFEARLDLPTLKHLLRDSSRIIQQAEAAAFELQDRESNDDLDLEDPPGN